MRYGGRWLRRVPLLSPRLSRDLAALLPNKYLVSFPAKARNPVRRSARGYWIPRFGGG